MDEEQLQRFADQLEVDSDDVIERWEGRPDKIIEDVFRVEDIDSGKPRDLELFDVQRKMVHAYFYSDQGTLNAYKGRRIGYSFIVVACFLLEALFYPNSYYPIVSRSLSQSKERIGDIETLIENAKIEIPTEKTNTDYIELWNGSAFEAYSSDSDTSRGRDSARAVLMDEMAFIEDEQKALRAFSPFLSLGENRKMVQISTPNTKNDVFMQTHRRGSRSGKDGVVSIKQPTFANAEDIDINVPLHEQTVEPVRPELNIDQIESERRSDPEGFGQEYLCRPVVDEYRFFGEDSVRAAQERSLRGDYQTGLSAPCTGSARRVMGVDIGINHDDTVLSIVDHNGARRKQREAIVASDETLREAGVADPDRANANHIATLISYVYDAMDVDVVVMDRGGVGQTFARIVEKELGRSIIGFDFSDREGVENMMGDLNAALRSNEVVLLDEERLFDEMTSIVKEKKEEHSRASFSGKENSASGKDDMAIATALSMFPPSETGRPATRPSVKEPEETVETPKQVATKDSKPDGKYNPSHGATSVSRSSRNRQNSYKSRRTRR